MSPQLTKFPARPPNAQDWGLREELNDEKF
jgi:hypothetical protein